MYKIRLKGLAGETNAQDLSILDGIDCQDEFSDYFDEDFLNDKVKWGYMHFEYNSKEKELYTIVDYSSKEELNEEEMKMLIDYTQGQLSDGIGEGFEQFSCTEEDDEEIFISPWFYGQVLTATQEKVPA